MNGDPARFSPPYYNNMSSPISIRKNRGLTLMEQMNIPGTSGGSSNVQENYSAYRINTNMGVSSGQNIPNKARKGFFGESYNTDEYSSGRRVETLDTIKPHNSLSPGKKTFIHSGSAILQPQGYGNQYFPQSEYYMFNQPYQNDIKPLRQGNMSFGSNPPFLGNNLPNISSPTLLPPIFPSPEYLASLSQQTLERRKQRKESYNEFAKLVSKQTQNLEKILKRFDSGEPRDIKSPTRDFKRKDTKALDAKLIKIGDKGYSILPSHRQEDKKSHETATSNTSLPDLIRNPLKKTSGKFLEPNQSGETQTQQEGKEEEQKELNEEKEQRSPTSPKKSTLTTALKSSEGRGGNPSHFKKSHKVHFASKKEKKRIKNIRSIMWTVAYPLLFKADIEKKVEELRKKAEKGKLKKIQELATLVLDHIKKHCDGPLRNLYKDAKSYTVVSEDPKKKLSEKDLKKNMKNLTTKLIPVLDSLAFSLLQYGLGDSFVEFFGSISKNHVFFPKGFLTDFEITCLDFTCFGSTKNMTPMKSKLLVGTFVLIKGFLFAFLTQPWLVLPNLKSTPTLTKGMKNCSSVFYHTIMEIYKENLPTSLDSQELVPSDKKLKPMKSPIIAFQSEGETVTPTTEEKNEEIMIGIYTKSDLNDCWIKGRESVDLLKATIDNILEKLYYMIRPAIEKKE